MSAADDESEVLVLDGFGGAVIGGVADTYTFESGIVTLEASTRTFMIDTEHLTYTELLSNDEWTGPVEFLIENAHGAYSNKESDRCAASIVFNKDLTGQDKEGYVALKIDLWDSSMAEMRNMISACPKYNYNKEDSTIILSNVLVGTGNGFQTVKRNLVLRVSNDLKSIWFDAAANGEKLYGITSPSDWFTTGKQNTLVVKETSAPAISGRYEASFPNMIYFGSPAPFATSGVIAIDSDASGAPKPGYAYFYISGGGMVLYDVVVEYEIVDNKLILKNLLIGDANYGSAQGNLEFEITTEGYLQGSATIYATSDNPSALGAGVDLSTAPFKPVAK